MKNLNNRNLNALIIGVLVIAFVFWVNTLNAETTLNTTLETTLDTTAVKELSENSYEPTAEELRSISVAKALRFLDPTLDTGGSTSEPQEIFITKGEKQ